MKPDQKRLVILIVSALAAVLVAAAGIMLLISKGKDMEVRDIAPLLERGEFAQAETAVLQTAKEIRSESDWYDLLSHVYNLAEQSGNYAILSEIAGKAVKRHFRQADFHALLVYGQFKTGQFSKKINKSIKRISDTRFEPILLYGQMNGAVTEYKENALLLNTDTKDPYIYERLSRRIEEPALALNSALLWMHQGNGAKVRSILRKSIDYTYRPEVLLELAFDSGEFDMAEKIIHFLKLNESVNRSYLDLMEADISLYRNDLDRALHLYENMINKEPDASWIPYCNSAWIHVVQGGINGSIPILNQALKLFPGRKEIVLTAAWSYARIGQEDEAMGIVKTYLQEHPEDTDAQLMEIILDPVIRNPEKLKTTLWILYAEDRSNPQLVRYFCAFLAGLEDMDTLEEVLKRVEGEYPSADWIPFFKALRAVYNGELEKGIELFERSLEEHSRWETCFNLGRIYSLTYRRDSALDYYQKASRMLENSVSPANDHIRSRIRYSIGDIFYQQGNYAGAAREAEFSLKLDPGNIEASLLLKKLEAEDKR